MTEKICIKLCMKENADRLCALNILSVSSFCTKPGTKSVENGKKNAKIILLHMVNIALRNILLKDITVHLNVFAKARRQLCNESTTTEACKL